jgi:hypothetical protein
MTPEIRIGAFFIWVWTDAEIEEPKRLRSQLVSFEKAGVSAVLAVLGDTRYELVDRKVARAVAQASQWARKRNLLFWFQADPRKASRSLITRTGEKTQNLFILADPEGGYRFENLNLSPVRNGRFEIRCSYPKNRRMPEIHESSLAFEPSGLEKAFAFRMHDGVVLSETIRDVSDEARFYSNFREEAVDVFGSVITPDEEGWRVLAFPRFDTNLTDYAGRESNDALIGLIEDIFDAGTSLSGVTWDSGGYCLEPGRFPVSLSLFNSFSAEYGYDLRNKLVALALPMDDGSHVTVRRDYYFMLMDAEYSAFRDFQMAFHGFFGGVDNGVFHDWGGGVGDSTPCQDPWRGLMTGSSGMTAFRADAGDFADPSARIFGSLSLARSLGVFSSTGDAFVRSRLPAAEDAMIEYWSDLTSLFSVRWMAEPGVPPECGGEPGAQENRRDPGGWIAFQKMNERIRRIEELTGFRFPETDVLVLYPHETLITADPNDARRMRSGLVRFIGRLALRNVQVDSVSPPFLRAATFSPGGFRIGFRTYKTLICPYVEILQPDVSAFMMILENRGVQVWFGGSGAAGGPPNGSEERRFDPESDDFSWLEQAGVSPSVQAPPGALGSLIRHSGDTLVLLCPASMGGTFEGEVRAGNRAFRVPATRELAVYKLPADGSAERIF